MADVFTGLNVQPSSTYATSSISVTSAQPATISDEGGEELFIVGDFKAEEASVYIVDGATEHLCYSGASGEGNSPLPLAGNVLRAVAPALAPGVYGVRVVQGAVEDTTQGLLTVVPRTWKAKVFHSRRILPPIYATGPRDAGVLPLIEAGLDVQGIDDFDLAFEAAVDFVPVVLNPRGANLTWTSIGAALPSWLTLNAATGALTGTASGPGAEGLQLQVTDGVDTVVTNVFDVNVELIPNFVLSGRFTTDLDFGVRTLEHGGGTYSFFVGQWTYEPEAGFFGEWVTRIYADNDALAISVPECTSNADSDGSTYCAFAVRCSSTGATNTVTIENSDGSVGATLVTEDNFASGTQREQLALVKFDPTGVVEWAKWIYRIKPPASGHARAVGNIRVNAIVFDDDNVQVQASSSRFSNASTEATIMTYIWGTGEANPQEWSMREDALFTWRAAFDKDTGEITAGSLLGVDSTSAALGNQVGISTRLARPNGEFAFPISSATFGVIGTYETNTAVTFTLPSGTSEGRDGGVALSAANAALKWAYRANKTVVDVASASYQLTMAVLPADGALFFAFMRENSNYILVDADEDPLDTGIDAVMGGIFGGKDANVPIFGRYDEAGDLVWVKYTATGIYNGNRTLSACVNGNAAIDQGARNCFWGIHYSRMGTVGGSGDLGVVWGHGESAGANRAGEVAYNYFDLEVDCVAAAVACYDLDTGELIWVQPIDFATTAALDGFTGFFTALVGDEIHAVGYVQGTITVDVLGTPVPIAASATRDLVALRFDADDGTYLGHDVLFPVGATADRLLSQAARFR